MALIDATYNLYNSTNVVSVQNKIKLKYQEFENGAEKGEEQGNTGEGGIGTDHALKQLIKKDNTMTFYPNGREYTISCKNKAYVELAPVIGLVITDKITIYVGAGCKYKSDKYTLKIGEFADDHKKTISKLIPIIKGGIRIWISDYFVKLEFQHDFKSKKTFKYESDKQHIIPSIKHTLKNDSTIIKLGVGKVF